MKKPVLSKTLILTGVGLLLWIGLQMIAGVVHDRQRYRTEATQSVVESLASSQTLLGPVLHRACTEAWDEWTEREPGKERRMIERRREFRLTALPARLDIASDAAMQQRARGLHNVNAYQWTARIVSQWDTLEALQPKATEKNSRMECGAPILMVAVDDARGIRSARVTVAGQDLPLRPGTFHPVYRKGLHAALPAAMTATDGPLEVAFALELVGTERLAVVPLGGNTQVHITSSWPHPSFAGRFLPSERKVDDQGFDATWRLTALATTAGQDVLDGKPTCAPGRDYAFSAQDNLPSSSQCAESFWVDFVDPVNPYSLSDRATKYGLLFIGLTFAAVALFEVLQRLRVHPVQYLLVGAAVSIFFLLLVSLSEQIGFGWAYAAASAACVALLAFYASSMLGSARRGVPFGAGVAVLYGLLYVLLQLEQTALAVGAVALFMALAAVMVLTRRIDWYGLSARPAVTRAGADA